MQHLMVDIETLGTKSYSVILSIGAVQFDLETGKTGKEFYMKIDLPSSIRAGLGIDQETWKWWMQQRIDLFTEMLTETKSLAEVLNKFDVFIGKAKILYPWGNSASFDLGLLANAYERIGIMVPWKFYNERCVRTVASLKPEIKANAKPPKDAHNALADCYHQIGYLTKTIKELKK